MNDDQVPVETAAPAASPEAPPPAAPITRGEAATLRTVARYARERTDALLAQARFTTALSNKRRLLASGAIGELRHLADTLDGLAVKAEEGGGR